MLHQLLLALLKGDQYRLACVGLEMDGASLALQKVTGSQLLTIDQGQCETVGLWPELFHQVQCQCGSPGPQRVQESNLRIKPHGFEGAAAVIHPEAVKKRQQGVEPVSWGTTIASSQEVEGDPSVWLDEQVHGGEMLAGGLALDAAQPIQAVATR